MSLFLKIFLWFWLAIALNAGVVTFINWSTQSEPIVRQWQIFLSDAVNNSSQTSAQIYENEGLSGLNAYLGRMASSGRTNAVAFLDANGNKVAGTDLSEGARNLFAPAMQSGEVEFTRLPEETFGAKKVRLKDGSEYVFIVQWQRPSSFQVPDTRTRILQVLGVILTAGLFCYGLARYLSSPITKVREATKKLAEGDLKTRVGPEVGKRHDELASLARDFDVMAERIEAVLMSQKRLTQDISHELRSPLARLNVALELAKQKANNETSPILDRIENESNRLNEMIGKLLTLSKLESGAENLDKYQINLAKLVEQVVSDADFEANAKNKAVKIIENQDLKVSANENLLRSAIENVLRNAVRYTKEQTTVEVSLKNGAGEAKITIRDFGKGVPENELQNLFLPFYRVGEARERKTGGIGLGLAIAERAVLAHKGTIQAKNTGEGLEVEIKIPISEN